MKNTYFIGFTDNSRVHMQKSTEAPEGTILHTKIQAAK